MTPPLSENRLLTLGRRLLQQWRLSTRPQQSPVHAALLAAATQAAQAAEPVALENQALSDETIVAFDLETSGLDIHTDTVLSIGAVTIRQQSIAFGQAFHEVLATPSAELDQDSQLIHGLTLKDLAAGSPPRAALLRFLRYSSNRIWLAYHAEFDRVMLQQAILHWLGVNFDPRPLDMAELAPMLFPEKGPAYAPLDHWLNAFGLIAHERHNALDDAMVTAELMLIMLAQAHRQGYQTWGELHGKLSAWRQVQRHLPAL